MPLKEPLGHGAYVASVEFDIVTYRGSYCRKGYHSWLPVSMVDGSKIRATGSDEGITHCKLGPL